MTRLRHTDEWVGMLVAVAILAFLGAVLQSGVLRDWLRPVSDLRILLPETGVAGLAAGAEVEVLGTRAGTVRRVVIQPDQRMYAEAAIDDQARAFIRRDSHAIIRRRFGVAGAAYIDISRGSGAPLDWKFAVLEATTERAPTEDIGSILDEVRQKIFPVLDDIQRITAALAPVAERIEKGEGDIGRLTKDDALMQSARRALASVQEAVAGLPQVIAKLDETAAAAKALAQSLAARDTGLPGVLRRTDAVLGNVQKATRDLATVTPGFPKISRNVEASTADLPGLLTQTQESAAQLELLLTQLRGMWLLGGSRASPEPRRLPASEVRP